MANKTRSTHSYLMILTFINLGGKVISDKEGFRLASLDICTSFCGNAVKNLLKIKPRRLPHSIEVHAEVKQHGFLV